MATIYVTKEGTSYKGKLYAPGESFITDKGTRIGGSSKTPGVRTVVAGSPELTEEQALQVKDIQQASIQSTGQNIRVENSRVVAGDQYRNRVVVSGRPEITQNVASQLASYSRSVGGRIEISESKVDPQTGQTSLTARPSTQDALRRGVEFASKLEEAGYKTSKEVLLGKEVPKTDAEKITEFKNKQTGYEVPSGLQGLFTRLSMGFNKAVDFVDTTILPSEDQLGKVSEKLGMKNEGVAFTDLVSRRDVVDVGSYFVPVVGATRLGVEIGRSAEQKKYGETALLVGIVYSPLVIDAFKSSYKIYQANRLTKKYEGTLTTSVPKDVSKSFSSGDYLVKGREVKNVEFGVYERSGVGRVSGYKINYGEEQFVPRSQVGSAEFYNVNLVGTKGGLPSNINNVPVISGEANFGLVTDKFNFNKLVSKRAGESFFGTNNIIRYDTGVVAGNTRFVEGRATFTGLEFSRETGLAKTGNNVKVKLKRLEMGKPLNPMQSGIVIEKGVAVRPQSDYLIDKLLDETIIVVDRSKKYMPKKIFTIDKVIPKVVEKSAENVGATGTITILRTEQISEPVISKSRYEQSGMTQQIYSPMYAEAVFSKGETAILGGKVFTESYADSRIAGGRVDAKLIGGRFSYGGKTRSREAVASYPGKVDSVIKYDSPSDIAVDYFVDSKSAVDIATDSTSSSASVSEYKFGDYGKVDSFKEYKPTKKVGGLFVNKLNRGDSFVGQVKKRGKFVNVTERGSFSDVFRKAQGIVRGTSSASFRVVGSGGVVSNSMGEESGMFYSSKKNVGVFVERNKFRINSPGEVREISYAGIGVQKSKRMNNFGGVRFGF